MQKTNWLSRIFRKNPAQTLSEYALILALIAIVAVTVMTSLGTKIKSTFQSVVDSLTTTSSSSS